MTQGTAKGRLPLLVIEDEEAVMAFMRAALERHGYQIVSANSGAEGLKMLATGEFMGVISDMRTPGGVNGADVHAWIVTHRPDLARRIIFVTGDTVNSETITLLRDTGAPCVEKPFRVQQFLATVDKVFGTSS